MRSVTKISISCPSDHTFFTNAKRFESLSPDSAADFETRHRALGRLANKKRLTPLDEQRLIDYVASHEDMLAESRAAALRNDVLNVLRLAGADRAELVSMLAAMIHLKVG